MQPDPRQPDVRWTARSAAAAAFFVLFLLLQIGVPLVRLAKPRPARFGWQMYSAKLQRPRFSLVMRDGTTRPADLHPYVPQSRGEVDLERALPQHLCRAMPDVASVQILKADEKPRVFACR